MTDDDLDELRAAVAVFGDPHRNPAGYAQLEQVAAYNATAIEEGYAVDYLAALFVGAVRELGIRDEPAERFMVLANTVLNLGVSVLTAAERGAR